jgi:hypothetical protein
MKKVIAKMIMKSERSDQPQYKKTKVLAKHTSKPNTN